MHRGSLIKRLPTTPPGVPILEPFSHGVQNGVVGTEVASDDQVAGFFENLTDSLSSGNLAHARMAGAIGKNRDIAGEVGRVCAAQVQQHAVVTRHRNDAHGRYPWRVPVTPDRV